MTYKDFSLLDENSPKPWGSQENQNWKDSIDTIVNDCIIQAKDTVNGHRHYALWDTAGNNRAVEVDNAGNVGIKYGNLNLNNNDITNVGDLYINQLHATNTVSIVCYDKLQMYSDINMNGNNLDNVATIDNNGDAVQFDDPIQLQNGTSINEFSIDDTLAGNSDNAVSTEKAIKTYVDGLTGSNTNATLAHVCANGSTTAASITTGGLSSNGDIDINNNDILDVASLTLNNGYTIRDKDGRLGIQSGSGNNDTELHGALGDGTENVRLFIWAKGDIDDFSANPREGLYIGHYNSTYQIKSAQGGDGTVHPIHIGNDTEDEMLVFNADGASIDCNVDLDMNNKEIHNAKYYSNSDNMGVSGSFTDGNSNTVTVENGIITSLS